MGELFRDVDEFLATSKRLNEDGRVFAKVFGFDLDAMAEVKVAYDKLGGRYPVTPEEVKRVFRWDGAGG